MTIGPKKIPAVPGVYIFRRGATPLYVGKAANLRQRLASYFTKAEGRTPKIERMLGEATRVQMIETASEIEALIKEAELIKQYRPKYNLLMRDDKSYFYVGITKEPFPRIFISHQPRTGFQVQGARCKTGRMKRGYTLAPNTSHLAPRYIGPFTSGSELHAALKHLRRVFPYCTCKTSHRRPCLASQIGRCPGYCCTVVAPSRQPPAASKHRSEYRKNIRSIVAVLEGKRVRLIGRLKREMREAVRRERYEKAARLRDAVFGLEDVFAHRRVLHAPEARYPWPIVLGKLQSLLKTERDISRIEGYDISNISGTAATGSMVVFMDGGPAKSQYRKFRIRTLAPPSGGNDVGMLKEVLRRRLGHPEWRYPELMVIDGGKPQLGAALSVLRTLAPSSQLPATIKTRSKLKAESWELGATPIVTALAKREEILYTASGRVVPLQKQDPAILHLFQRIRDESHRFAQAYHHTLRKKALLSAR